MSCASRPKASSPQASTSSWFVGADRMRAGGVLVLEQPADRDRGLAAFLVDAEDLGSWCRVGHVHVSVGGGAGQGWCGSSP
jgi:hypothetical protein